MRFTYQISVLQVVPGGATAYASAAIYRSRNNGAYAYLGGGGTVSHLEGTKTITANLTSFQTGDKVRVYIKNDNSNSKNATAETFRLLGEYKLGTDELTLGSV